MLEVKGIENGIVLDHIRSGNGLRIFNRLFSKITDFPVVLLMNVESQMLGKKDIIKIENHFDVDLNILGLIDKNITVNIIKNGILSEKKTVSIPKNISGLFSCDNPRCISNDDDHCQPDFELISQNGNLEYVCSYCEEITKFKF